MDVVPLAARSEAMLQTIDRLFRQVDREIWIVTSAFEGQRGGLTATWVIQASIDPTAPLVLIGLALNHYTAQLIGRSHHFGLHLLRSDQIPVAWNFARDSSQDRDKFLDFPARTSSRGVPLLKDCRGWLECRVVERLAVADRWYMWADILEGDLPVAEPGSDTVLTERQFFAGLDEAQRRELTRRRDADMAVQRPWIETWRTQLPSPQ